MLYVCFVDMEKASDRVQKKMLEWGTRKKGIPEFFFTSVMDQCEATKT